MLSWELVKRYVLERDNHRCRVCGRGNSNQVHHRFIIYFQEVPAARTTPPI